MSKRFFLFITTIMTLILASCTQAPPAGAPAAPAESTEAEVVELSFWSEWSGEPSLTVATELIEQFNESHPNIKVVHRPIENEQFFTALRTGFTSGNPPDVFQHEGHNNLGQFVEVGEVADMSDWWAEHQDRFQAGTDASIKFGGKFYGVPWAIHTNTQIYYNETVLAEHGIDGAALQTWDDYLAAFQTLDEAGVTPLAYGNKFGWSGGQWFFNFLVRWVGTEKVLDLVARNCNHKWTDPDIVQAAKLYTDLNDMDYFSSGKASDDYPSATALFFAGKTGFFHTGSWFVAAASVDTPPDFKLGMNVFPIIEGGQGDPDEIVMQGLTGLAISQKGAEEKGEAALTFINWMTEVAQAQYWVKNAFSISPINGAMTEETAHPFLLRIIDEQISDNTGSFPFLEHILPKTVGEDEIWMGSVGVLTGQLTAETWMEGVEEDAASQDPTFRRDPTTCD